MLHFCEPLTTIFIIIFFINHDCAFKLYCWRTNNICLLTWKNVFKWFKIWFFFLLLYQCISIVVKCVYKHYFKLEKKTLLMTPVLPTDHYLSSEIFAVLYKTRVTEVKDAVISLWRFRRTCSQSWIIHQMSLPF